MSITIQDDIILRSHKADGSDSRGDDLLLTIRIGADGNIYFHDVSEALAPVMLAMNPHDALASQRAHIASEFAAQNVRDAIDIITTNV